MGISDQLLVDEEEIIQQSFDIIIWNGIISPSDSNIQNTTQFALKPSGE